MYKTYKIFYDTIIEKSHFILNLNINLTYTPPQSDAKVKLYSHIISCQLKVETNHTI